MPGEDLISLLGDLDGRGLIHDHTDRETLIAALAESGAGVYIGFDPTASSLHLGHFLAILGLIRFQRAGVRPIAVVGGATGMIGDPSGRNTERDLLSIEKIEENKAAIRAQLEHYLDFSGAYGAVMVDNADWTRDISFLHFLRDIGKHFNINHMLHKESVSARLDREAGLSFTEFSYMLLQAFDYLVLYRDHHCRLQMGGSDQWGNITMGMDLIRKVTGQQAHGLTFPLVTNSQGQKFGKSEGNALWLDPSMTSPYQIYQYFLNTGDADVPRYLAYFTFLSREDRDALHETHQKDPGKREAHRTLAREVTALLHGNTAMQRAEEAGKALFSGALAGLDEASLKEILPEVPNHGVPADRLKEGIPLVDLLAESGALKSKSEARRKLKENAISLNDVRTTDEARVLTMEDTLHGRYILLKMGKRQYTLVEAKP